MQLGGLQLVLHHVRPALRRGSSPRLAPTTPGCRATPAGPPQVKVPLWGEEGKRSGNLHLGISLEKEAPPGGGEVGEPAQREIVGREQMERLTLCSGAGRPWEAESLPWEGGWSGSGGRPEASKSFAGHVLRLCLWVSHCSRSFRQVDFHMAPPPLMPHPSAESAAGTVLGEVFRGGPATPAAAAVPGPVLPSAEAAEMKVRGG